MKIANLPRPRKTIGLITVIFTVGRVFVTAQTNAVTKEEVERLRSELNRLTQEMQLTLRTYQERINQLESAIRTLEGGAMSSNQPTAHLAEIQSTGSKTNLAVSPTGDTTRFQYSWGRGYIGLSLEVASVVGWSTTSEVAELNPGAHNPKRRGFTLQNVELALEGAVDPYFQGTGIFSTHTDPHGEFHFEWEEAYAETFSIPGGFQLKAGKFLTEFGRHNSRHSHQWDFVDAPLVLSRLLGPHGLNAAGMRVSWLAPTPFYSELFFTVQDSRGDGAYSFLGESESSLFLGRPRAHRDLRGFGDLLFVPRYAVSFDLTDSHTILLGASTAFGPNNAGYGTRTEIYGVDLTWKWKLRTQHGGYPFVSFTTEALLRRAEVDEFSNDLNGNGTLDSGEDDVFGTGHVYNIPSETVKDWGLYTQVSWGFKKGWVASLRGEYVAPVEIARYENILGPDPERVERWRISPSLTHYLSEFSLLRLQYNYDDRKHLGEDHSMWFQLEFSLGEHGAHKF